MTHRRGLAAIAVAFVAIAAGSASAASAWTLRFSFVPERAYQSLPAAVSVLVKPPNAICTLGVRYAARGQQGQLFE